eukprot:gene10396-7088_t
MLAAFPNRWCEARPPQRHLNGNRDPAFGDDTIINTEDIVLPTLVPSATTLAATTAHADGDDDSLIVLPTLIPSTTPPLPASTATSTSESVKPSATTGVDENCKTGPCLNGGQCNTEHECTCPAGFAGKVCEVIVITSLPEPTSTIPVTTTTTVPVSTTTATTTTASPTSTLTSLGNTTLPPPGPSCDGKHDPHACETTMTDSTTTATSTTSSGTTTTTSSTVTSTTTTTVSETTTTSTTITTPFACMGETDEPFCDAELEPVCDAALTGPLSKLVRKSCPSLCRSCSTITQTSSTSATPTTPTTPSPCDSHPCLNSGTCTARLPLEAAGGDAVHQDAGSGDAVSSRADDFNGDADLLDDSYTAASFVCSCRDGYSGVRCEDADELSGSGDEDEDDDGSTSTPPKPSRSTQSTSATPFTTSKATTVALSTATTTTATTAATTLYEINCMLKLFEGPMKNTRFTRTKLLDRRERVASATTCGEICKNARKFGCIAFVYGAEMQLCRLYTAPHRDDVRATVGFDAYFMSPRCLHATASATSTTKTSTSTSTTTTTTTIASSTTTPATTPAATTLATTRVATETPPSTTGSSAGTTQDIVNASETTTVATTVELTASTPTAAVPTAFKVVLYVDCGSTTLATVETNTVKGLVSGSSLKQDDILSVSAACGSIVVTIVVKSPTLAATAKAAVSSSSVTVSVNGEAVTPVNFEDTTIGTTTTTAATAKTSTLPTLPPTTSTQTTEMATVQCKDFGGTLANQAWEDVDGDDCSLYSDLNWCTQNGCHGSGWTPSRGVTLETFATNGVDASMACCACGGGTVPTGSKASCPTESYPTTEDVATTLASSTTTVLSVTTPMPTTTTAAASTTTTQADTTATTVPEDETTTTVAVDGTTTTVPGDGTTATTTAPDDGTTTTSQADTTATTVPEDATTTTVAVDGTTTTVPGDETTTTTTATTTAPDGGTTTITTTQADTAATTVPEDGTTATTTATTTAPDDGTTTITTTQADTAATTVPEVGTTTTTTTAITTSPDDGTTSTKHTDTTTTTAPEDGTTTTTTNTHDEVVVTTTVATATKPLTDSTRTATTLSTTSTTSTAETCNGEQDEKGCAQLQEYCTLPLADVQGVFVRQKCPVLCDSCRSTCNGVHDPEGCIGVDHSLCAATPALQAVCLVQCKTCNRVETTSTPTEHPSTALEECDALPGKVCRARPDCTFDGSTRSCADKGLHFTTTVMSTESSSDHISTAAESTAGITTSPTASAETTFISTATTATTATTPTAQTTATTSTTETTTSTASKTSTTAAATTGPETTTSRDTETTATGPTCNEQVDPPGCAGLILMCTIPPFDVAMQSSCPAFTTISAEQETTTFATTGASGSTSPSACGQVLVCFNNGACTKIATTTAAAAAKDGADGDELFGSGDDEDNDATVYNCAFFIDEPTFYDQT